MAEAPKNDKPKSTSNATVIKPPAKVYRWGEGNTVAGKLVAPIVCVDEKYGKRTRIALDSATVLLPSRYSTPYAGVPVNAMVSITKSGTGRDTEYELAYT